MRSLSIIDIILSIAEKGPAVGNKMIVALRVVLVGLLAGSLFVQVRMVPLLAIDLRDAPSGVRVPLLVIIVLGIAAMQVTLLAVWRLLTMVRRGTVFSDRAFRYVDVIFGAMVAASLLTFAIAVILAPTEVPPGIVLLVCGASALVGCVALIVMVLRMLLAKAVSREVEAANLKAELDEVI